MNITIKRSQDHLKLSKILYSMITTENESIFAEFLETLSKINKGMIVKVDLFLRFQVFFFKFFLLPRTVQERLV